MLAADRYWIVLEQFTRFAREIFGLNTAEEGIAALEAWFDKIGTPTHLPQLGITDVSDELIENILSNAEWFGIKDIYTHNVVVDIINKAK